MTEDKENIRNSLRNIRSSLNPEERKENSRKICGFLQEMTGSDERVLVYCAKEPEVETSFFIDFLLQKKIPVVVPIIQKEDISLRLSLIHSREDLICSTFQVPEPVGAEIPINPEDVTIIILPMLGFDRSGARLGYGAGYYDRFLQKNPHMKKIGIAYSCQEVTRIPTNKYDIMMDVIVTEKGTLIFR